LKTLEVFNARAFRLAIAFALAIALATTGAFAFIYWQVYTADFQRAGSILVDEAAKSQGDSENALRQALQRRLTHDIRRLDFVALFDPKGALVFGNVQGMPAIPVDGQAHVLQQELAPDASGAPEPAIFVARRLPSGGVLLLGRSLLETFILQRTLLRAMAVALPPTVLVILGIGVFFARRASQRFERIHGAIVRIMNGELDSRLPVANEDSDVDKVARAVNLMLDEIAGLLAQLKSAGDNIAHDLRTPLAVASAKIERALNTAGGVEQLREVLEVALDQIHRLSRSISAILRVSAIENAARKTKFKDFDLAAICAQVFDFYEPLAESKGVRMAIAAAEPVPVRGDEDLMREAVSNLVDNALKFTPEGGAVRIEARSEDGRLLMRVSDTGPGVPPQEREKIFDRFYRGEGGSKTPGHGLGLTIAASIASLHGLKLMVVDNNPGARFELAAPLPHSAAPTQERGMTHAAQALASQKTGKKILI
jgi:signal transduction histidine kinase